MPESSEGDESGRRDVAVAEDAIWQLAGALAGAATPWEVAQAVAEHGAEAAGAAFANMALLDADRAWVRAVHDPSVDPEVAARWAEFDLQAKTPLTEAMLTGAPILIGSLDALESLYPHLVDDTVVAGLRSTASLPLRRAAGTALGAVGIGWAQPQTFPADQRRRLDLIAQMTGQALDRAVLFVDERNTSEHLRVLQQLTARLAGAVTAEQIATVLTDEVAPLLRAPVLSLARLADGVVERFPHPSLPVLELYRRTSVDAPLPTSEAIRTGRPVILPTHRERAEAYPGADWVSEYSALGPLVALPAHLEEEIVGALMVVFDGDRLLDDEDLGLLLTLAGQCAQALERARLLEAERQATARERRHVEQLRSLQTVTARLAAATTVAETAKVIVDDGMALVADRGMLGLLDADGHELQAWPTPGFPSDLGARFSTIPATSDIPIARAVHSTAPLVLQTRAEMVAAFPSCSEEFASTGSNSVLAVSARSAGRPVGALAFGFTRPHAIDDGVLALTTALADLTGQALQRAALHERTSRVAETLQRSLLPALPVLDELEVTARYVPGSADVEVGGDWYDVIDLGGGRVGLVIGDVMGRGVIAAAVMGQLRAAVRAYAQLGLAPGELLTQLDGLVRQLGETSFVTCLYGVYDPAEGQLTVANAGHFPPVATGPGQGGARLLSVAPGPPLGTGAPAYADHPVPVAAGTVLVFFTDGLVEARNHDLDDGLATVLGHVDRYADQPLPVLADTLIARMRTHHPHDDDTALLVVRVGGAPDRSPRPVAGTPAAAPKP